MNCGAPRKCAKDFVWQFLISFGPGALLTDVLLRILCFRGSADIAKTSFFNPPALAMWVW